MYTVSFALLLAAAIAFLKMIDLEGAQETQAGSTNSSQFTSHHSPLSTYRYHILFVLLSTLTLLTHYNVIFILVTGIFGGLSGR